MKHLTINTRDLQIPIRGMRFTLVRKLPHIPQATTTEQHETGESSKKDLRRLSCTPYIPHATAHPTSYHD